MVAPLTPVTVTEYDPAAAPLMSNVMIELEPAAGEGGAKLAVAPEGSPVALSATLPANPPSDDTLIVTVELEPAAIDLPAGAGVSAKSGAEATVKARALLTPLVVVTVRLYAPGAAPDATERLAVIVVALASATFETETPVPLTATVLPYRKFVPVRVTGTVAPGTPFAGLTDVSPGAGAASMLADRYADGQARVQGVSEKSVGIDWSHTPGPICREKCTWSPQLR